jgi:hypothetical protein
MQDGAIRAEDAGAWLREHAPQGVEIKLVPAAANAAVYREIQDILFGPEEVGQAS